MAKFNEVQRTWVDKFLGEHGRVAQEGAPLPAMGENGNVVRGAPEVAPVSNVMAQPIADNGTVDPNAAVIGDTGAVTANTTGGTGPGAPGGSGSGGGGSGSGTSGTPGNAPRVVELTPQRVLGIAGPRNPVLASVSSAAHADAWRMLGQTGPVPIAYMVGNNIHVDMTRWPANVQRPTITPYAPGGPKINPSPSKPVPPMQFPNNPNNTLQGTKPEPGGGAGKGPGGTVAVPDKDIAATHRKAPSKTKFTFSTSAHTDIWAHLGNKPPAPIAFMQDGHMRVDVERWGKVNGQWSGERLGQVGLVPTDPRLKVGFRGEPGAPPPGSKDYPGHREPPPGVYDKQKSIPNADMRSGADRAQDAIKKGHTDKQGVWTFNNRTPPELKNRLDQFADPKSPVGKSVKDIDLHGKSAVDLHKELIAKGFKHHWEPLAAGKDAQGNPLYKMRDGGKTPNPKHPNVVPHDIYVHKDGGMVRVKPEGDPGDKFRPQPHASKAVVYDTTKGSAFANEAFKVTNEGHAVPKNTDSANGMKQAPPSGRTGADVNQGFKDATMSKAHTDLPKTTQGVPAPKTPTPGGSTPPPAGSVPRVNMTVANALHSKAEDHKKNAKHIDPKEKKNPSKSDIDKVQKENVALKNDLEKVTKELRSHPDLKAIHDQASSTKDFYRRVKLDDMRTIAGNTGMFALKVAKAYELVNDVRFILDSNDVNQFIKRSVQVGQKHAQRWITFGILKYVFKIRDPISIVVTTLFSSNTTDESLSIREKFENEIAKDVNKVRPGSIKLKAKASTADITFADEETKQMFKDAVEAAGEELKEKSEQSLTRMGYENALSGAPTKRNFEVSDIDRIFAKVDNSWMAQVYAKANGDGDRKLEETMQRVEAAGFKDGQAGKPENFEPIKKWPELLILFNNYSSIKEFTGKNDKHGGDILLNRYKFHYHRGYDEGEKAGKALVLDKLIISPNGFTMGAHTVRQLTVKGTFTNNSEPKDLTGELQWRSSNENAVKVSSQNGVVRAELGKQGYAEVTASYKGIHGEKQATISVTVNMPTISIYPENPKAKVGQKLQFRAFSNDKDNDRSAVYVNNHLDSSLVSWSTDDKNIVDIDSAGNATIKAAGRPLKIYAFYTNTPVQASTTVTIG